MVYEPSGFSEPDRAPSVLHVAATDGAGGADRAARRIHEAIARVGAGRITSSMLVHRRLTDDPSVLEIGRASGSNLLRRLGIRIAAEERRLVHSRNQVQRSAARVPSSAPRRIERINPDVVLLHWLGNSVVSIRQLGRLFAGPRPVLWVLHDTWAFCGAEHYPDGDQDRRFIDGYTKANRSASDRGWDLDRHTWRRKLRHWTFPAAIVAPSQWMADLASRSALMQAWPVQAIPNPLDTAWWGAIDRGEARRQLGIPSDRRIVLFGAVGGEGDPRKGADLLRRALVGLRGADDGQASDVELVTFGGAPGTDSLDGTPVRSVGKLDDAGLRLHYSAANVMVVPSRQDNLPQTAVEAIACGTPVVAFRVGGLADIVEDGVTGRLVEPLSPTALADGIVWTLDSARNEALSESARSQAARFDRQTVGSQYARLLRQTVESQNR